jgi:hypothetical protein
MQPSMGGKTKPQRLKSGNLWQSTAGLNAGMNACRHPVMVYTYAEMG